MRFFFDTDQLSSAPVISIAGVPLAPSCFGRQLVPGRRGHRRTLLSSVAFAGGFGLTLAHGQGLVELTAEQVMERGEVEIGAFEQVQSQVDRFYRDQKFGEGRAGDRLISNEIVSSYENGLAVLTFDDGSTLTVGPYSEILLDEYIYEPGTSEGSLSINILSGMAKLTTGSMPDGSYKVDTPVGTAAIRGSEVVFFVEPFDGVSIAVLTGEVGMLDATGRLTATARGDSPLANFLFATKSEGGTIEVQQRGITPAFNSIQVPLDTPSAHPNFIVAYKSEIFGPEIIEACLNGGECGPLAQEFLAELSENFVELQDAQQALIDIRGQIQQAGGNTAQVDQGIIEINTILGLVEETYEPNVKFPPGTIEDGDSDGDDGTEEALTGLGAGAGAGLGTNSLTPPTGDAAPTAITLSNTSIAENATSLQVGLLQVVDDQTTNPNFVFALVSNGITNDHLAFSIDDTTGALSFINQPDYEVQTSYTFDVRVTDEGGNAYTETLTVTVGDVLDTGTYWSDAMVADSANFSLTGTNFDDFAGYSATNLSSPSPLSNLGKGAVSRPHVIDLQNGNNHLLVGDSAASGASINYIGGTGNDTLTFGNSLAANSGNLSATLGNGINSVSISNQAGVTIGSGSFGSSITLDGGSGTDQVTVGNQAGGTLTFRLGDGSNSVSVGTASSATFAYVGGSGPDSLSLQSALTGTIDFGSDVAADSLVIPNGAAGLTISNFDVTDGDTVDIPGAANTSNLSVAGADYQYTDLGTPSIQLTFGAVAGAGVSTADLMAALI